MIRIGALVRPLLKEMCMRFAPGSQRAREAIITSSRRQHDVADVVLTSWRRYLCVIIALCVRWVMFCSGLSMVCICEPPEWLYQSYHSQVIGLILGIGLANERPRYITMSSFIGWAHTHNSMVLCKGGGAPMPRISKFYRRHKKLFWSVSIKFMAINFQYAFEYDERVLLILIPSS